jgi:hypothetical protein
VSSRLIPFPALAPHECSALDPVSLRAAVAPARRRHRSLIVAAGQWALAHGVSLPADHVALWAAAAGEVAGPWRASALPDLVARITEWCALAGCALPPHLPESLWHLYGFLAETGRLHPASDSLIELRASVAVFATFDRFRPIPSPPPEPTAA